MSETVPDLPLRRPPQRKVPFGRAVLEIPKLLRTGPTGLADLVRAAWELALARHKLARRTIRQLGIPDTAPADNAPLSPAQQAVVARVSYAMQVVPPRVPWRSDCLVQCLAARRWLAARGIASRVSIGMKRESEGALLAHAWLATDGIIVTGGDLSGFSEFQFPAAP